MTEEKQEAQGTEPFAFTIEEAAQALKVSVRTVRDLLASGEMDDCARLVGRTWRISPTHLREWLRGGKGKQAEEETEEKPQEKARPSDAITGRNNVIRRM